MTQRILVELGLFLIPFAVFLFYRIASRELRVVDRWPLTTLVVLGGVLAVGAFVLGPLLAPSDKGKCYQAARYEKGVTIPAKLVDCKALEPGAGQTTTSGEPAPVAPRDENRTPARPGLNPVVPETVPPPSTPQLPAPAPAPGGPN